MARTVDMTKLLAKIAKVTNTDEEELKEVASKKPLYSFDEAVMEMQSVINFYRTRIQPREPKQGPKESQIAYTKRLSEYWDAYNEWRFKTCETCKEKFAYAYHYEGVKFCSLDCLDTELRKIGLKVTYGRDLKKRWGFYHPAVVPSTVLQMLESLPKPQDVSLPDASEECSDPDETDLPLHLEA